MDRQGFPVLYVEKLSKKACNISATGMNLELFGKILELEWIWNWTKFDFRLGEWNWTSSNFDLEDRNGSKSKKYGPVTMYVSLFETWDTVVALLTISLSYFLIASGFLLSGRKGLKTSLFVLSL